MADREFGRKQREPGDSAGAELPPVCSGLNQFAQALAGSCSEEIFREKWLLAPSLRIGHQWLDAIAMKGHPVINCRVKTLKGMALEIAGPEMVRSRVSLLSAAGSLVLMDGILGRLPSAGYLSALPVGPGLCKTTLSAVNALRLAGVDPGELRPSCFEEPAKSEDLTFILSAYLQELKQRGVTDYAGVLRLAADAAHAAASTGPGGLLGRVLVLIPENHDLTAAERSFVKTIPEASVRWLPVDRPAEGNAGETGQETDLGLMKWLLNPSQAPAARGDGSVTIFQAAAEVNEVREVLRRCLESGYPFDQVELLHTDRQTFVPLIFETFLRIQQENSVSAPALPVTFAEGIPTTYSRPGRCLTAWLAWIGENYPQESLCRMIQDGLVQFPELEDGQNPLSPAGLLRTLGIGWGRERYEAALKGTETSPGAAEDELPTEGQERPIGSADVQALRQVRAVLQKLLDVTPTEEAPPVDVLLAAARFVEELAASEDELDNYSRAALVDKIREMGHWIEQAGGTIRMDVREWLAALPAETWVAGSGPRPGRLHVANVASGGFTARPHTFIIGLDDGRFPGAGLNDPLLLDTERSRLSAELPSTLKQPGRKMERLATLLAGLRGTVTLGFSSFDLATDRSRFPSPAVFSAFRIISGNRDADQSELIAGLGLPACFAPLRQELCLDETEWWLWRLCVAPSVRDPRPHLEDRFPHLLNGRVAREARESPPFTEYDGKIPDPPAELDPASPAGPALSATMLETMAACPLKYFFRYVLGLKPPERVVLDPNQWLDPPHLGEFLHEAFHRFMSEIMAQRRKPQFERDMGRLTTIQDELVRSYEKRHPSPGPAVFRRQTAEIFQACRIFLKEEEVLCRTHTPMFLEVSIGMGRQGSSGPLDALQPLALSLGQGRSVRVRGRLDRVDRVGDESDGVFTVCDYKSGSLRKFEKADLFRQGRVLQHGLYLELAAAIVRQKISGRAKVEYFEYFFPSLKGRGRRIRMTREQAALAMGIIDALCFTAARGYFPATADAKEDCKWCDYASICGDFAAATSAAAWKLENSPDPDLEPLRELHNCGKAKNRAGRPA